jgi:hypothetical protein
MVDLAEIQAAYYMVTISARVLPNPSTGVVSLTFDKLSQICRFEKGEFCKKVREPCSARVCPQIR